MVHRWDPNMNNYLSKMDFVPVGLVVIHGVGVEGVGLSCNHKTLSVQFHAHIKWRNWRQDKNVGLLRTPRSAIPITNISNR